MHESACSNLYPHNISLKRLGSDDLKVCGELVNPRVLGNQQLSGTVSVLPFLYIFREIFERDGTLLKSAGGTPPNLTITKNALVMAR